GSRWGGLRYYKCGRYHQEGKRGCYSNIVREAPFFAALVRKLQDDLEDPKRNARLHQLARERARQRGQAESGQLQRLRKRAGDLARQIDQGLERMAMIDADLLP